MSRARPFSLTEITLLLVLVRLIINVVVIMVITIPVSMKKTSKHRMDETFKIQYFPSSLFFLLPSFSLTKDLEEASI